MSVDIPVGQNYLDINDVCKEQEFAVQAIIGSRISENSSAVSSPNGKCIKSVHHYQ